MFDKEAFANMLKKINSTYDTMTEFAEKSGVDRAYISKYINMKLDNPPTPKILMKIANHSNGITTYDELMNICGFTIYSTSLEKTKNAQSILAYDNLVKKIPLSENEKKYLKSLYFDYHKLRKSGISLNQIRNKLLNKIQDLPSDKYNIKNMKKAFELYILSVSANNVINYIYDTHAEIDTKSNYIDYINKIQSLSKDMFDTTNNHNFYMCPVYGQISAGQPNWAEANIEGRLPIDTDLMDIINPEEYFFLRVNGESMNNIIKNGAFALIHKQDVVEDGEIAVVLVNGYDATLKRFTKKGDVVVLEPDSSDPSFKTQIYDKTTSIKILGKYVGKMEINK